MGIERGSFSDEYRGKLRVVEPKRGLLLSKSPPSEHHRVPSKKGSNTHGGGAFMSFVSLPRDVFFILVFYFTFVKQQKVLFLRRPSR